jgi:hypothetical protein
MRALAGAHLRLSNKHRSSLLRCAAPGAAPARPMAPLSRATHAAAPAAAVPAPPLVSDLGPMLQKLQELNNGVDALAELVPLVVDGGVLGRMRPE